MTTSPGNTRAQAPQIQLGSRPSTFTDVVSRVTPNDYYQVRFQQRTSFDLTLSGLQANANVELQRRNGSRIARSARPGRQDERINLNLDPGIYYVRVYQGQGNTRYQLRMSANVDRAGDSRGQARAIIASDRLRTFRDYVGPSDRNDFYRFTLDEAREIDLRLSNLQANADLRLLDSQGRLLDASTQAGTRNERITTELEAGTYYLRVTPRGNAQTRYALTVQANPLLTQTLTQEWISQIGTAANDYAYGIVVDSRNRVYIAGTTGGNLAGTSAGGQDAFIAAFNAGGGLLDIDQVGTNRTDIFSGLAMDANDNLYAVGTWNLGRPSLSPFFLGSGDAVLAHYRTINGELISQAQDTRNIRTLDSAADVAVDANGTVLLAGAAVQVSLSLSPTSDTFVASYTSGGSLQQRSGDFDTISQQAAATSIAVDAAGNIYVAGITNAELDINNPGNPYANSDAFIAKYSANGTQLWFNTLDSGSTDTARRLAVDRAGNVYAVGHTEGSLPGQTGAGGTDAWIVKYDTNGQQQWLNQFGTSSLDEAQAIALDAAGNIYVTGETEGSLFGTHQGGSDAWIVKYSSSGREIASLQLGTAADEETYGITVSADNHVYVVGQTQGVLGASNAGNYDVWVGNYSLA
ncbi:MAG TPA: SBBP repeat-containing protein [Candidatus Obscuribacterales bacterium]